MPLRLPRLSARANITQADALNKGQPADYNFIELFNQLSQQSEAQFNAINSTLAAISYPFGVTITAEAVDATFAKIVISDHSRIYLNLSVAVDGGEVAGVAYATDYWIYYDDPDRAGGAVTYFATTTQLDAFASAEHPDRLYVGSVLTPATETDPPTEGVPGRPPGDTQPV